MKGIRRIRQRLCALPLALACLMGLAACGGPDFGSFSKELEFGDKQISDTQTTYVMKIPEGKLGDLIGPSQIQWVIDQYGDPPAHTGAVAVGTKKAAKDLLRKSPELQCRALENTYQEESSDEGKWEYKDSSCRKQRKLSWLEKTLWNMYQNLLDFGDGIMATIEIPSIGVDLPVRHGADAYALENGAGHLHGTSLPVGGQSTHSVITGHTGVADKALFTRLTELRKGDVFYVRVAAQTLAYKVERIRKVDPDDLRDVRIQPGRDLVTLVTCTPIFLNTYRLLVTGERVSMPDDAPYPEDAPRTTGRDARPLLVSGVALLAGMPVAMVESRPRVRPYGRHGMKR